MSSGAEGSQKANGARPVQHHSAQRVADQPQVLRRLPLQPYPHLYRPQYRGAGSCASMRLSLPPPAPSRARSLFRALSLSRSRTCSRTRSRSRSRSRPLSLSFALSLFFSLSQPTCTDPRMSKQLCQESFVCANASFLCISLSPSLSLSLALSPLSLATLPLASTHTHTLALTHTHTLASTLC